MKVDMRRARWRVGLLLVLLPAVARAETGFRFGTFVYSLESAAHRGHAVALPTVPLGGMSIPSRAIVRLLRAVAEVRDSQIQREGIPCAAKITNECALAFEGQLAGIGERVKQAVLPFARQVGAVAAGVRVARWLWPGPSGRRRAVSIAGEMEKKLLGVLVFREAQEPANLLLHRSLQSGDELGVYRAAHGLEKLGRSAAARAAHREYLGMKYSRYSHLTWTERVVRIAIEQSRYLRSHRRPVQALEELLAVRPFADELPGAAHARTVYRDLLAQLQGQGRSAP
jgi:hypothetical protein